MSRSSVPPALEDHREGVLVGHRQAERPAVEGAGRREVAYGDEGHERGAGDHAEMVPIGAAAPLHDPDDRAWQDEHMADNGAYDKALLHLQEELVKLQQWVRDESQRLVIVVEGRDAAGKGGVIKRITEYLNPRWCRSWPCPPRATGRRASGTSSATSPIFRPAGRS